MSTLQQELLETTSGLSDTSIAFIIEYVRTYIVPFDSKANTTQIKTTDDKRKLGVFEGEKLLSDGYDFDESNDEIAKMFGVD